MDLLTHPVFQQLISVKWKLFGKLDAVLMACINFLYTVLWTALGATLPDDRKYYSPLGSRWWRLALDILGVLLTLLFIFRVSLNLILPNSRQEILLSLRKQMAMISSQYLRSSTDSTFHL